tara:strand:+ start:223 stop:822 length:600 start_codon:yes stop_codon:yes gene_type:complete
VICPQGPDLRRSIGVVPVLAPKFSWCLMDLTEVWGPTYILKGYTMTNPLSQAALDRSFIVRTQTIINENYDTTSAHNWKCKGGNTYIVQGVTTSSNAMAFVMSAFSCNTTSEKEFPVPPSEYPSYQSWKAETLQDARAYHTYDDVLDAEEANKYIEHVMSDVYVVSPVTGRQKFQPDGLLFFFFENTLSSNGLELIESD